MYIGNAGTKVAQAIIDAGYSPMLVGGYVRDNIIGRKSKDIDIEVHGGASLSSLEKALSKVSKVDLVGQSFAVIKVNIDGEEIDVSLPRTDSKSGVGHRDFEVKVDSNLTPKQAASRRDLTINAIMFDIKNGKIVDPFNGVEDIHNRILRVVDESTFGDDPLRVIRAARFSAQLGMTPDSQLMTISSSMDISSISFERIWGEMEKIFKSDFVSYGLDFMKKSGLLEKVGMTMPDNTEVNNAPVTAWVAATNFPAGNGVPISVINEAKLLKRAVDIISNGGSLPNVLDIACKNRDVDFNNSKFVAYMQGVDSFPEVHFVPEIEVNGQDAMNAGFRGRDIGTALNEVQHLVNRGQLTNRESQLNYLNQQ